MGPDNPVIIIPAGLSLSANEQRTVSVGCYNGDMAVELNQAKLSLTPSTPPTGSKYTLTPSTLVQEGIPKGGKAYWGLVIKGTGTVTPESQPEVITLTIFCEGADTPNKYIRPLTITYK